MFSSRKKGEGFALVGIIIAAIILVGIAGVGYYVLTKDSEGSDSSSQQSASDQALIDKECEKEIDDKDFCKFVSNWSFGGDYKMTVTTTGGSDSGSFVTEVYGENSSSVFTGSDGVQSKFIYLNGSTYTYNDDTAVWIKYTGSTRLVI